MKFPLKDLQAIEAKYGTADIPNDNPMMVALHKELGVTHPVEIKKSKSANKKDSHPYLQYFKRDYENDIIKLINDGYTIKEVCRKLRHSPSTVRSIVKHYHLYTYRVFTLKADDIYLTSFHNLMHWNIKATNLRQAKIKVKQQQIELYTIKLHLCDLPKGSKYMLDNDLTVYQK